MISDILRERYHIINKLDFKGYSTVWLARDTCLHYYITVKVNIADSYLYKANIIRALASPGHDSIPTALDEFKLKGPNKTYKYYTITPVRCNLRDPSFNHLFSLEVTQALAGVKLVF